MLNVLLFFVFDLRGGAKEQVSPVTSLFLMKDIFSRSRPPIHRGIDEDIEQVRLYGEEFLFLFHESLQDGFFGGVKWGIAACFYQVLYELSSGFMSVIPESARYIRHICKSFLNMICGRPEGIRTCDLSVLAQLFYDIMHDFNGSLSESSTMDISYAAYRVGMVKKVCTHLIGYLEHHKKHYSDSGGEWTKVAYIIGDSTLYHKEDVAFIITLLVGNLTCILERIDTPSLHEEIPQLTAITLRIFHTLGLLLQCGSTSEIEEGGVFGAWFSGERSQEVTHAQQHP